MRKTQRKIKAKKCSILTRFSYPNTFLVYTFQTLLFFIFYIKRKPVSNFNKNNVNWGEYNSGVLRKHPHFIQLKILTYIICTAVAVYIQQAAVMWFYSLYRKSQIESQTDYTNFLTQFLRMYFVLLLLFFHPVFLSSFTTVLYTLWRLLWSITVHMHGKMQSIWFIKTNSNVSVKDLGARKKKNKSGDVIWRHPCVCLLIDHDQQPMKMHTEVTL